MLFLFDDFSLDRGRCELKRGDTIIAVEPQVFDVLVYLLENRQRVVSRDDLIAAVWKGRIVSELTLSSRITAARQALADNGEVQRLIRTISRKGFRFVGEVIEADEGQDARARATGRESLAPGRNVQRPGHRHVADLELSALIGDIYDAALDPSLWTKVLEKSSRFAGAAAASLASWSLTSKVAKIQYTFGITPKLSAPMKRHIPRSIRGIRAFSSSESERSFQAATLFPTKKCSSPASSRNTPHR